MKYVEGDLIGAVSQISKWGMAAFAASCAERTFVVLAELLTTIAPDKIEFARHNLDRLWNSILKKTPISWTESQSDSILALVEDIPLVSFPNWLIGAQDSVAAIVYTALTLQSGDEKNVGWAARCAYDITFYAAEDQTGSADIDVINATEVVQSELERQARDLSMLLQADEPATYKELKALAEAVDMMSELRGYR
jgi:Protein of unknown function (DUF416)